MSSLQWHPTFLSTNYAPEENHKDVPTTLGGDVSLHSLCQGAILNLTQTSRVGKVKSVLKELWQGTSQLA